MTRSGNTAPGSTTPGVSGASHAQADSADTLSTFPGELYVKDAHKSFGVTKALNRCSFSANFGEIHAIVGGNGCGKSTLAKVLSGVLPMDSGKLSIRGQHPSSPAQARSIGVATVFQEVMIADEASVVDNLYVGADGFWTKALSPSEKLETATALMNELAAEEIDMLAPAGGLSLSLKAWITIGRALLCKPDVLILDESSAALDFDSTERLFLKMRQLRDNGAAIIIVTHRIAELIRISDRATVMRDGKDVGVLSREEITESNLLSLMTGRENAATVTAEQAHKTSSSEVVLRTRNVHVWPDAEPINFELLKGEIVGVTGLDGHGQDQFVRILAGVEQAVSGFPELSLNGTSTSQAGANGSEWFRPIASLDEAKQNGIAFVSGDRKREGILPNMSIFENLLLPLYKSSSRVPGIRLIDWAGLADIFEWEVERLAIKTGPRSNPITSLSGGNQQKVMIGRSFALHPKILILNDPARGIDVDTKRDLYKHLREYASEGNSVIYMSSELEEFIGFCSRVLVFRNGSVFKTFVDNEVEPVGILEGMFGRLSDLSSTSTPAVANTEISSSSRMEHTGTNQPAPFTAADIKRIRIVEYGDNTADDAGKTVTDRVEKQQQQNDEKTGWIKGKKMKISYFN